MGAAVSELLKPKIVEVQSLGATFLDLGIQGVETAGGYAAEVTPEQRASENPYLGTVRWHARFGQTPRLEDLEAITDLNRLGPTEYRHAWAWVHFLLHGPPEGRDELARYLTDLDADVGQARLSGRLRRRWPASARLPWARS